MSTAIKKYVSTTYSPAMVKTSIGETAIIEQKRVPFKELKEVLKDTNAVKVLADPTASILSNMINQDIQATKAQIKLEVGDILYYVKIAGPRLEAGTKKLPESNKIQVFKLTYKGTQQQK